VKTERAGRDEVNPVSSVLCETAFSVVCERAAKQAIREGLPRSARLMTWIMAWSVDRLGRCLQDLIGFLSEIHALRIDLYLHQQGLDTRAPAGKAMPKEVDSPIFPLRSESDRGAAMPQLT
jgi:hypothetical protein